MATRAPFADENGNIIQTPPPEDPVMKIIYLLEYARVRGFRIGPNVQVGDTIIQVSDLRQMREFQLEDDQGRKELSIWQTHGHDEE